MRQVIAILLLSMIWVGLYIDQTGLETLNKAVNILQGAGKMAAHDAFLSGISNGAGTSAMTVDLTTAETTFLNVFDINAGFSTNNVALPGNSLFGGSAQVVYSAVVDNSNATFPDDFVNATYGINEVLNAPAVIFVVQVQTKSYTHWVSSKTMDDVAVYQYGES